MCLHFDVYFVTYCAPGCPELYFDRGSFYDFTSLGEICLNCPDEQSAANLFCVCLVESSYSS